MKRSLMPILLLLLISTSTIWGANLITVDSISKIPSTSSPTAATIYFNWENDKLLQGVSNGYKVTTSGPATAKWAAGTQVIYNDLIGAMGWQSNYNYADSVPSRYLFGGAYLPGVFPGVAANPLRRAHSVDLELIFTGGPSDNAIICVDSAFVPPAGDWVWDPGGGQADLDPPFNSDAPYCFEYGFAPCQPPIFTTVPDGDTLGFDHCTGGAFQFAADPVEPGAVITGYGIASDPSGLASIDNDGYLRFESGNPGDYPVSVECYNDCPGTSDPYAFMVSLTNSGLAYNSCPTAGQKVSQGNSFSLDLGFDNFDCDPITENYVVSNYTGPSTGVPVGLISLTDGVFTFETTNDDVGTWEFEITGNDGWGETAVCQFTLEVTATSTWGIRIGKIGGAPDFVFQGHYAVVPVFLDYMGTDAMGGFDFLIAYDASALTMINVERGDAISCWEYFTYRNGPFGNCVGSCPSGQLRIVAMAESNNGPYHPTGCDGEDGRFTTPDAELAKIKFFVTSDLIYECQFVPVYFFWMDCGDNAISDWIGNKLFISNHVYSLNWINPNNPYYELIPPDGTIDENDRIYGAFDYCDDNPNPGKPGPIPDIDFYNGGVDIACADEIDLRGDLNLNNLPYEIADAVLFTNYFIYGPSVFDINYQGQVSASDVNNDGRSLTVGDLVYLIRILTGDAQPFEKLSPFAHEAGLINNGGILSINSPVDIGAALLVFDGIAEINLLADDMDILADVVDGQTRALIYSISKNHIEAGTNELISIDGDIALAYAEISDYYGNQMNANIFVKQIPKAYTLHQNYPNPFNPTTEISFDLPLAANWTVDIFNIAGQTIKSYTGYSDAGIVKVSVDANGWASGIYFYRVSANDFVATKKMVLMK